MAIGLMGIYETYFEGHEAEEQGEAELKLAMAGVCVCMCARRPAPHGVWVVRGGQSGCV